MPRSLGFAEGSGEMSAERPRHSEPPRRAEEWPARAPRPRPEGACAKARGTSAETSTTRRTRGLCEVSRGRPGRAAVRRYDLPLFANAKEQAPGPRVVLSAAKNNLGRRQGARRARKPEARAEGGISSPQGELCERKRAEKPPKGAGERQEERPLQAPHDFAAAKSGCEASKGKGPLRAPSWRSVG